MACQLSDRKMVRYNATLILHSFIWSLSFSLTLLFIILSFDPVSSCRHFSSFHVHCFYCITFGFNSINSKLGELEMDWFDTSKILLPIFCPFFVFIFRYHRIALFYFWCLSNLLWKFIFVRKIALSGCVRVMNTQRFVQLETWECVPMWWSARCFCLPCIRDMRAKCEYMYNIYVVHYDWLRTHDTIIIRDQNKNYSFYSGVVASAQWNSGSRRFYRVQVQFHFLFFVSYFV